MEMEAECLLDTEMLGEDQTTETSDEVSRILLHGGEEVTGGSSCIPSAMDFEFTNSDLGSTSDFSIDHSSMFDIPESVIDEKGDCGYLFKDSSIFEDVHVKQSGEIDNLGTVSCTNKKTNVCNDLGLRLQIIPLNNLQFVSTIQTSEGLHILAVPAGSNLSVIPQISSLIAGSQTDSIVPHTADSVNFSLNEHAQNLPCPLSTATSQRTSQELVSAVPIISDSETILQPKLNEKFGQITSTIATETEPVNFLVSQDFISASSDNIKVKKKPVVVSSKTHRRVPSQLSKASLSPFPNKLKSIEGRKNITQKSKVCKESKIVIDLRKLAQTRKKQMVSLLNNPRTKSLLHLHSQKLKNENEKSLKAVKKQPIKDVKITQNNSKQNISPIQENAETADVPEQMAVTENDKISTTVKKKEIVTQKPSGKSAEKKIGRNFSLKQQTASEGNSIKRNFICEFCYSKFNREGNYKNHLLLHENSKIYNFQTKFETRKATETENIQKESDTRLRDIEGNNELEDETADQDSAVVIPDVNSRESTVQFRCKLCSMVFSSEGNLTRHKLTHSVSSKSELRFSCEVCKRNFLQRCDLKRHQLTHTGQYPYTCSICSKGFIRRSDLTVHERFHLKEKTFRCDLCSKAYYQSGDLHRHIRHSHSNECEYTCTQCDRKYSTQKSLNQHLTKHLRQRN